MNSRLVSIGVGVLAILGVLFLSYRLVVKSERQSCDLDKAKVAAAVSEQYQADIKKANEKAKEFEAKNQAINKSYADVQKRLKNVLSNPVYKSCLVTPDGVREYNALSAK